PPLCSTPLRPHTTPFPYPTLFRSADPHRLQRQPLLAKGDGQSGQRQRQDEQGIERERLEQFAVQQRMQRARCCTANCTRRSRSRSEEHTSELQSRVDLVCRLLLEN